MKYIISILILLIGINTLVAGQDTYSSSGRPDHAQKHKKEQGYDPSRLIFGGGVVLAFGTGYADLGISPIVGYRFTNNFSAGVGIGYEYLKSTVAFYDPNTGYYQNYQNTANIISPNIWARYIFWRNIFVEGTFEYDILNYGQYYTDNFGNLASGSYSVNVPCLLMGAGVKQSLGGRASLFIEILYDVLQNPNSPYYETVVPRAGIVFGF
jgi:hypothetical protein